MMLGGLALGASLAIYLNTSSFRNFALGAVNSRIKGRVALKDHHLSLVSGRLTLTDLTLLLPDDTTVADIHHLSIGIFWPALAWRTIDITSLMMNQAEVTLRQDDRDRLNLMQVFEPSGLPADTAGDDAGTQSWQVRLKGLALHNVRGSYERPAQGLAVAAGRIEATGNGDLMKRAGRLQVELFDLAVKAEGVNEQLTQLTVTAAYDGRAEWPATLAVNAAGASISLKAFIEQSAPVVRLKADCDLALDLSRIDPWLPQVEGLNGRLKGRVTLQGTIADPDATLNLVLTDGSVAGVAADKLTLDADLSRRRITIHQLGLLCPWGDVKLEGRVDLQPAFPGALAQMDPAGWQRVPYDLAVRINTLQLDRIPYLSLPVHGVWQGDMKLAGVGFSLEQAGARLEASLKIQDFKTADAGQPEDGRIEVTAAWQERILTVEHLRSILGSTTFQGQGRLDWVKREVAGEGMLNTGSVARLGALFDIPLPDGKATLNFSTQGLWPRPAIQATLAAEGLAMAGWRFGNLSVAGHLDHKGRVTFSQLAIDNGNGRLAGKGRLTLFDGQGRLRDDPGVHAVLDAAQLQLSDFNAGIPVDLALNGRLTVDGLLLHPKAMLNIDDSSLQWQKLACKASGTASWDDGFLEVSRLRLENGRSNLDLSGTSRWRNSRTGAWTADPQVTANVSADALLLETFQPDARGTVALQVRLQGAVSDLEGAFTLHARDLGTGDQRLADADLQGRLSANVFHVKHLTVTLAPGQQVTGSGWYALVDQRFQLALKSSHLALAHLTVLQQWDAVGGFVDLDIKSGGTLEQPMVNAEMLVHAPVINEQRFDDFRIDLRLQDRLLTATANLNFNLAGQYRMDSGQFDFSADFSESDLSSFLSLALNGQWAARLSGSVRATGNWHTPAGIEADVALSDAWLDYQAVRLLTFAQLSARLAQGRITLSPTPVKLMQQGQLMLSAEGDIERQLALAAEGVLPLAVLAPFTDSVDRPRGEVRIAAHASGPWDRLQWQAELTARNAGAQLTYLDQTLRGVNGRVRIDPDEVQIENISGMLDDGHFSLDGRVRLADGRPDQGTITVKARALPLQWPDTMDMKISADLTLKGGLQKADVAGRIVLLEGAYYKRLRYNLLSALTRPQRAKSMGRAKGVSGWQKAIELNVAIVSRYPFLVDNNIARLEVAPDLKLTGTAAAPIINGRAAVTEGEVFFRGRTFTVTQGVVDFINPYKIEPTLDITAETRIREYQISLAVSGTPDNLMIKLDTNQSLSDADILSLILLGRINGDAAEQNGSSGATTAEMLAALMTSVWGDEIKKSTGVDILEIGTVTNNEDSNEDITQFTVGKQLTRRLTVKYALESGGEQMVQRAISEYRLLEHILASGFQDTAGKYGGELMFRIEFR